MPFGSDGLVTEVTIPVAVKGLLEGVDAAESEWDQGFSPDLENVRVGADLWQTRLGTVLWQTLPGSGSVRFLDNLYMSSGARTRLAAQGNGATATLYELKEGTDTGFVAASGGTSLGGTSQNLFQGVTLADRFYLTDRANPLWRYTPTPLNAGNHLQAVGQPAAPTAAPGATRRAFMILWDWTTGGSDSSAIHFDDIDATAAQPSPITGKTRQLQVFDSGALGATVSFAVSFPLFTGDLGIQSHTLAYWVRQDRTGNVLQFQVVDPTQGVALGSAALYADTAAANTWYPFFLDIGDLTQGSFQWDCTGVPVSGGANLWVSTMVLPGTLEGPYRWVYTHYDSTTFRESAPSAPSNNGQALDFSAVGVSYQLGSAGAFAKSCALTFTSDSGTDATTDRIRVYRSGGVPELTVDDSGTTLWLRVADVPDYSSTLSQVGGETAGASLLHLTTVPATLQRGMWLVLEKGVAGKQEFVQVSGVTAGTPGTVNVTRGLGASSTTLYAHAQNTTVQIALLDNTPNEQIDLVDTLDVERNNPPAAARFVARSPEGRLWLFNYQGAPTGIAISNKPTPDRPFDYEVFPDGVDPLTRRSVTQGFRVQYTGGISQDEEIMWGGFFQGHPLFLTRNGLYEVRHQAQVDWSATSIQLVHKHGCIAGDTVVEQNGVLYWVAPGPRVMAWNGEQKPVVLSDQTVNVRLNAAPAAYWQNWFATPHTTVDGAYYKLYVTPAGATTNTLRLDFNINRTAWEPVVFRDSSGAAIGYQAATVRGGNIDTPDHYQIDTTGKAEQCETGDLDRNAPIQARFTTNKIALRRVHPYWESMTQSAYPFVIYLRLAGVTDTAAVKVTTGGGEYGEQSQSYPINLAGTGDVEIKVRCHPTLKGRWLQIQVAGSYVNRPAFRWLQLFYVIERMLRAAA